LGEGGSAIVVAVGFCENLDGAACPAAIDALPASERQPDKTAIDPLSQTLRNAPPLNFSNPTCPIYSGYTPYRCLFSAAIFTLTLAQAERFPLTSPFHGVSRGSQRGTLRL
jgi:hypothetical protein